MPESKILIVDDEKNILLTVRHALESKGYDVASATTGEEALRLLEQQVFDLMLLDLKLPGIDGMHVLKEASEKQPQVPVVIISAYGTVGNAVEAMKLGAIDFLEKPFSPEELRETVRRVLARRELPEAAAADYESCIALAKKCVSERRFDAAIEHARRATGIDPSRPEAFNLLGVFSEVRREPLEAQKYYRTALELDPAHAPARHNLTRLVEGKQGPVDLGQE
jgi:DNA-binding NtrC family response regulator